jgi:hypothetical protein
MPSTRSGIDDVVVDRHGEGVGLLEDHAHALAQRDDVDAGAVDVEAVDLDLPSMRRSSIRSFMRLRQRSRVDLPQPEGPISAVTMPFWISMLMSKSACDLPYQRLKC